jgi:hypothetical protein
MKPDNSRLNEICKELQNLYVHFYMGKLVSHTEREKQIVGIPEYGAEEDIWASQKRCNKGVD